MKLKMNGKRPYSPSPNSNNKPWKQPFKHNRSNSNNSLTSPGGGNSYNQNNRSPGQAGGGGNDLQRERRQLPMWGAREKFLSEVGKHNVVVLLAETGSGKTTQVPQFLYTARMLRDKMVAVTQPRRVAAVSLAKRVAREMGGEVGGVVGFRVRFQDVSDTNTKLLYQTDGMLLREAMLDNQLSRYSWVVLDEAHERTVNTDILFGVVKAAVRSRSSDTTIGPLKVIVMSATVDADKFSQYWGCPVLYVAGRQFAVNVRHVSTDTEDWQRAMLSTIFTVHQEAPAREDILAFMTGQEEIENMARQVRTIAKEFTGCPKLDVVTLYAAKTSEQQQLVFKKTGENCRKLVLATNIAETSVTIPGVSHVIDSCRVKAKVHQAGAGLDLLKVVLVSQAQARQRTGRAGREREGTCYRLVTAKQFTQLEEATVPEIQRSNLASVALTMLNIGIENIQGFDFMDAPSSDDINSAVRQLKLLAAVSEEGKLTQLGRKMAGFPLEPRLTAAILAAGELGCAEEMLTIIALVTGETVFNMPGNRERREQAEMVHRKFSANEGDLVTLLNVWKAYRAGSQSSQWCQEQFLVSRHLLFAAEVRKQLVGLCHNCGVKLESCRDMDMVRKALARGLFMNVAQLTTDGHYVALDSGQQCYIHPQSVLFKKKPEVVVFTEMVHTTKTYLRGCSLVDAAWLQEFQPEYFRTHRIK